ncbi:hypothetical protein Smic_17700 [Streptomyces microflavus]|uniref:indole-3-glycerol-phosphate synthase n=1 Tax=Streptomyces microflavus TaxID=1919 RepID=A0A7J0CMT1_STRMI|nr:hypothetical protein Smic_17700 [Streptomyces microflavus]
MDAGAKIIGVNARNLKDLKVDRSTFERVAPRSPTTSSRSPSPASGARTT